MTTFDPDALSRDRFAFLKPLVPTRVFQTYWKFAAERQRIFLRRIRGEPQPWTQDPILGTYKFTNAYRASDRVSQYLVRNVIYSGTQTNKEVSFRTLLFKFFNRIDTWELLQSGVQQICWEGYSYERYDTLISAALDGGHRIYSAAYIMPSGGGTFQRKHRMHLRLLEKMMNEELPERITSCKTMHDAFLLLRSYPTIGDFLAYQYVTDLNYSEMLNFSENEFTVAGPGARDGIRKCFSDVGGMSDAEVIRLIAQAQFECFKIEGIRFPSLWGRPLQLIDCQNLFCEVDKYSRVAHPELTGRSGRTRIKQQFRPLQQRLSLWYPPKWEINTKLNDAPENLPT
jgi:alpha-glutamyl/putrescinyl thymine pyrophosphorylase clade 1